MLLLILGILSIILGIFILSKANNNLDSFQYNLNYILGLILILVGLIPFAILIWLIIIVIYL